MPVTVLLLEPSGASLLMGSLLLAKISSEASHDFKNFSLAKALSSLAADVKAHVFCYPAYTNWST